MEDGAEFEGVKALSRPQRLRQKRADTPGVIAVGAVIPRRGHGSSCQQFADPFALDVRQPPLQAVVLKAQSVEVEDGEVKDGRFEMIQRMDGVDRLLTKLIGAAVA